MTDRPSLRFRLTPDLTGSDGRVTPGPHRIATARGPGGIRGRIGAEDSGPPDPAPGPGVAIAMEGDEIVLPVGQTLKLELTDPVTVQYTAADVP